MKWRKVEYNDPEDMEVPEKGDLCLVVGRLNKEIGESEDTSVGLVIFDRLSYSKCKDTDQYGMWYSDITYFIIIDISHG